MCEKKLRKIKQIEVGEKEEHRILKIIKQSESDEVDSDSKSEKDTVTNSSLEQLL